MEGIHTLKEIVRPNDWMVQVDLKDAFFTVPIHNTHKQYLRFRFQGPEVLFVMGLYQDSQTSHSIATREGDVLDCIH